MNLMFNSCLISGFIDYKKNKITWFSVQSDYWKLLRKGPQTVPKRLGSAMEHQSPTFRHSKECLFRSH